MRYEFVIVGGGLAGLYIASELERQGYEYLLLEARPRLGGRILSLPYGEEHFDLGPAWFWPQVNPRLKRLIESLGLAIFPQYQRGGMILQSDTGFIHKHHQSWVQNPRPMRVVGGVKALIEGLTGLVDGARVRLSCEVSQLQRRDDAVCIDYSWHGTAGTLEANKVVLALPPRVFCKQIDLQPKIPTASMNTMMDVPTWMASRAKAVAVYADPFWRRQGLSGLAISQLGPLAEIYDASPGNVSCGALFGFFHWHANRRAQSAGELESKVCEQLGLLYGSEASQPAALFIQDWATDSWTSTEQDICQEPSHPKNGYRVDVGDDWRDYLELATSEMAPENAGYLEGAVEAAQNCLKQMLPAAARSQQRVREHF